LADTQRLLLATLQISTIIGFDLLKKRYIDNNGKLKYKYFRICTECEDQSWVSYKPKSNVVKCSACSRKELAEDMHNANTKQEHEKVRYERVCVDCGDVRIFAAKPKTPVDERRCGTCSRRHNGKSNASKHSNKDSSEEYCDEHEHLLVKKHNKTNAVKKPKRRVIPKAKQVSQQAIDRARAINKEHRESLASKETEIIPRAVMSDEDMVKRWLENNKPTVKEVVEYESWSSGLKVNGKSNIW
jgi:ribosomal protein S27E